MADERHAVDSHVGDPLPKLCRLERAVAERVVEVEAEAVREERDHGVQNRPPSEWPTGPSRPVDENEVGRLRLELHKHLGGDVVCVDASPGDLLRHEWRVVDGRKLTEAEPGDECAGFGAEIRVLFHGATEGRGAPGAFSLM
jgi:hypothetical protein